MIGGRDNRTPHNELGPYDTPREYARPVEEVAKAIAASKAWPAVFEPGASSVAAQAAINALRDLGFITLDGLRAIKAEERSKAAQSAERTEG
jgi:hypothetical protein